MHIKVTYICTAQRTTLFVSFDQSSYLSASSVRAMPIPEPRSVSHFCRRMMGVDETTYADFTVSIVAHVTSAALTPL